MQRWTMLFPGLAVLVAAGCGDGKKPVTGTVKLDGKPVAVGTITFVRTEGELVREGALIRDGTFTANVPPGKYRVELSGRKVVGKRKQIGMGGTEEELEITDELFPAKFNTKSELTEEIKPGTPIVLDLKSEP